MTVITPDAVTAPEAPATQRAKKSVPRSKLRTSDAISVGTFGLRNRRGRTVLTALGISIGIASIVSVLGISSSSKADLLSQIDELGTNLLTVQAGESYTGESTKLTSNASAMVRRIGPVESSASLSTLQAKVTRNVHDTTDNGVTLAAAEPQLINTIEGTMSNGRFLTKGTTELPTAVLGSVAAERLGISSLEGGPTVTIAGKQFAVVGIMNSLALHPDLDRAVFIGIGAAEKHLGAEIHPTGIYVRSAPEHLESVRNVLPATVSPGAPNEVKVSRPSDALEARAQVDKNLQNLLLGLGGVSLLVGGVGIANVMIISVLERRGEIGLRRAMGATRRHIAGQFVLESASLAALGGVLGAGIGAGVTYVYATQRGWAVDIPMIGLAGGAGAALVLGALAGLYPAVRASRLDPAEAVRPA